MVFNTINIECPDGYEVDKQKSTYSKIVFRKILEDLPKTWIDCLEKHKPIEYKNCTLYGSYSDKLCILNKLLILRDIYNNGWKPSYISKVYAIESWCDEIRDYDGINKNLIFSFKDLRTRNLFYKNFKSSIEFVKDLI